MELHDWIHVWAKHVGHVCEVTPLTVVSLVSYWPIADGLYQAEIILAILCHLYFCLIMVAETLSNVLRFCVVIM